MTVIDHWIWAVICPLIAYFIGSIPFSYIVARWRTGEDLRETGNRNVGGLNVMIKSGFNWGIFAGFLDFSKGLICLLAALLIPFNNEPLGGAGKFWEINIHNLIYIFVAMAVILGHNYPIFLKFQGGRGVAVTVSFMIIANPLLLLVFVISMAIFTVITKYVRPSTFMAVFIGIPIAFFLNFFPPWIILNGMDSTFVLGLFTIGIAIAFIPKYFRSFIDMFKGGKEYKVGKTGGIILQNEKNNEQ